MFILLCCGCRRDLAWFKLPVVDDAGWDDGRVVPVTCAAVILAGVVTLSGFAWHTPCQTTFLSNLEWTRPSLKSDYIACRLFMVCLSIKDETHSHSVKPACDILHSGSPGGPVLSQGRCWAHILTGGWPLTWHMAWWSGSCTYCGSGSSNLKRDKDSVLGKWTGWWK